MRQIEAAKQEYIEKLKKELESVEERYLFVIDQNCMVGEDYRTYAEREYQQKVKLSQALAKQEAEVK